MLSKLVVLCMLVSQVALAADPDNVFLNTGQLAPYTGVLFPQARAQRVLEMKYDLDSCTKIQSLTLDENSLITKRLQNAQSENDRLALQLEKDNTTSFLNKTVYFMLGAVLTGVVAYGAAHAVR